MPGGGSSLGSVILLPPGWPAPPCPVRGASQPSREAAGGGIDGGAGAGHEDAERGGAEDHASAGESSTSPRGARPQGTSSPRYPIMGASHPHNSRNASRRAARL